MVRSPAKLATLIVIGTFIGGAIGFYVRENWNLKERERHLVELEEMVAEKKSRNEQIRNQLKKNNTSN